MSARSGQSGFVLVATIAIVAVMALAASAFSIWVSQATEQARALKLRVEAELELVEAQAIVSYYFSVFPLSVRGLELPAGIDQMRALAMRAVNNPFDMTPAGTDYLALDDTPYKFGRHVTVRLQDARGLVNLNLATREQMFALFNSFGIAQERQDPLYAKLRDYIEPGESVRLGGAKSEEYRRAGKPTPPYALLTTPWQALGILSWSDEAALWEKGALPSIASASLVVGINANTAPVSVLQALAGLSREAAEAVVAQRRIVPIVSPDLLLQYGSTKFSLDPLTFITFPADTVRARLSVKGVSRTVEFNLTVTPVSNVKPWQIAYKLDDVPNAAPDEVARDALVEFPDPKALLAPR